MKIDRGFEGVVVALMTPMQADGSIDEPRMQELVDLLLPSGLNGLYVVGSSGEAPKLTLDERKRLIGVTVARANGKIPVLAGVGGTTTAETVEMGRYSKEAGAEAAVLLPPYYYHPGKQALKTHYETVASKVDLPLFLYNAPNYAGYNHSNDLVIELVKECANIVGIKDSSGNMMNLIELIDSLESEIAVFQGLEPLMLCSLVMGANGAMVSDANVAPALVVDIFQAYKRRDWSRAIEGQRRLSLLDRNLASEDFIASTKEAMRLLGMPIGATRQPTSPIRPEDSEKIGNALQKLGLTPISQFVRV
jgi:4-hydroxy-tetrahydrodipicolinate synthase